MASSKRRQYLLSSKLNCFHSSNSRMRGKKLKNLIKVLSGRNKKNVIFGQLLVHCFHKVCFKNSLLPTLLYHFFFLFFNHLKNDFIILYTYIILKTVISHVEKASEWSGQASGNVNLILLVNETFHT